MRNTCLDQIYELAKKDSRVVFIGSDLRLGTLQQFKDEFPDRYFMEGINEQNIIGMAAGLAMDGYIPYVNTVINIDSLDRSTMSGKYDNGSTLTYEIAIRIQYKKKMKRVIINMKRVIINMKRVITNMKRVLINMNRVITNMKRVIINMKRVIINVKRVIINMKRVLINI